MDLNSYIQLKEAYSQVGKPQQLTESVDSIWEEVEAFAHALVEEEGLDLSDMTWDEVREAYIEEVHAPLQKALHDAGIRAEITGRPKNFYSIHKKMQTREKEFEDLYDLLAIRILVDTIPECYHVLGLVHSMYTPIMSRLKDFIANPKSNRYQSLHTTVVGPRNIMLEVQLRTHEMHETAEVGIAAHWL